jgi:sialate O-acetylesterase
MVLQRDQALPVWGTAEPGQTVTVSFRDNSATAEADPSGRWTANLPPQTLGKPASLRIQSGGQQIVLQDVLVGEVWICSGQSNMQWRVAQANDAEAEIAAANYPSIRLFEVPNRYSITPEKDVEASWQVCSPETVADFSAVGYYFGRKLWQEMGVPVGLVSTNWGGTPAEAWTPLETLKARPEYAALVADYQDAVKMLTDQPDLAARIQAEFDAFTARADELSSAPPAPDASEFQPGASFPGAQPVQPDTQFLADVDGLAHVRNVFSLDDAQAARANARLQLGKIDNFDVAWINGVRVGSTLSNTPGDSRNTLRDYAIPDGTLKAGQNTVLIQIVDIRRIADFGRDIDFPKIAWSNAGAVPLQDDWHMRLISDIGVRPDPLDAKMKDMGSFLWNGMVAPLVPAPFQGVIWYQGESNASRAEQYRTLFPDMIEAWRAAWGRGNFPFYFVQLANFDNRDGWPELREAQRETLTLPNTGMAVAIDIGDPDDIHPTNKQDVGRRLALWALAETYGVTRPSNPLGHLPLIGRLFQQPIPHSGPLFTRAEIEGPQIRLNFDHVYRGLETTDGGALKGFTIAEADGPFKPAKARIDGDTIVVTHPGMTTPTRVRYAWDINPEVNLINSAGLPAAPFGSD